MISRTMLASLVALGSIVVAGCSGTPEATTPVTSGGPGWIDRPNGPQEVDGEKAIFAVGVAAQNPNPAARKASAIARARQELASSIQTQVRGLVQDYMNTNRDFYNMEGASSVEYFEQISSQVVNEALVGSKQVDSWRDPADNTEYVLMRVDLDSVISSYRSQMETAAVREMQRKRIKVQKDDFEKKLDEQIQKIEELDVEKLRAMGSGA
ncbi:MAG: hypothetical protein AB7O52_03985 [Planctomycetota bacterium]